MIVASQFNSPERDIFQVIERLYRFDDCLGALDLIDYRLAARRVLRVLGKPDAAADLQSRGTPGSSPNNAAAGRGRNSQLYAAHAKKAASCGAAADSVQSGGRGDAASMNSSGRLLDETTASGDQSMPQPAGMLCLGCRPRNGLSSNSKSGLAARPSASTEGASSSANDCARRIAESAYVNDLVLNKQLLGIFLVAMSQLLIFAVIIRYIIILYTVHFFHNYK